MSATQPARKVFTPEEKASYRAWLFGSTLDWSTRILVEINYPIEQLRWFIDAVQGLCKGEAMRICHSTLAKRAQRFKNKSQARDLTKRAIEADREWARLHRRMVFDIESPKPNEREGKDKRARTLYTDYLTAASVWAQEAEHKAKKADELKWKREHRYRITKQREILAEAVKMLPEFDRPEDMPESTKPKVKGTLSDSEYVEQREKVLLAEKTRILDRLTAGDLIDPDEIDNRLAVLEVSFQKVIGRIKEDYGSTRDVLLGLKRTHLQRAMNMGDVDTEEVEEPTSHPASEEPSEATQKGVAGTTPRTSGEPSPRGVAGTPLSDSPEGAEQQAEPTTQKGVAGTPLPIPEATAKDGTSHLAWALFWASHGIPVFPLHEVFDGICSCTCTRKKCSNGEHGCGSECARKGKHPRTFNGLDNASTDPVQIKEWWRKWPHANLGGRMGGPLRLFALDIDPKKGGSASLADFCTAHGEEWMDTLTHKTGGDGFHFLSQYPDGVELRNSVEKIAPGVDGRGEDGYIILPPSVHASGASYSVFNLQTIKPTPEWLIEAALATPDQPPRKVVDFQDKREKVFSSWGTIADGTRSDVLFKKVACGARARGAEYDEVLEALYEARTRCEKSHEVKDATLRDMASRCVATYPAGPRVTMGGRAC